MHLFDVLIHIPFLIHLLDVIFKHGCNLNDVSKYKIVIKCSFERCSVSTEVTYKGIANVVVIDRKMLARKLIVNSVYQNFNSIVKSNQITLIFLKFENTWLWDLNLILNHARDKFVDCP